MIFSLIVFYKNISSSCMVWVSQYIYKFLIPNSAVFVMLSYVSSSFDSWGAWVDCSVVVGCLVVVTSASSSFVVVICASAIVSNAVVVLIDFLVVVVGFLVVVDVVAGSSVVVVDSVSVMVEDSKVIVG